MTERERERERERGSVCLSHTLAVVGVAYLAADSRWLQVLNDDEIAGSCLETPI